MVPIPHREMQLHRKRSYRICVILVGANPVVSPSDVLTVITPVTWIDPVILSRPSLKKQKLRVQALSIIAS